MGKTTDVVIDQMNHICVFPECSNSYGEFGHNAYPLFANGRCCEKCNSSLVVPERIVRLHKQLADEADTKLLAHKKGKTWSDASYPLPPDFSMYEAVMKYHANREERAEKRFAVATELLSGQVKKLVVKNKKLVEKNNKMEKELDDLENYYSGDES